MTTEQTRQYAVLEEPTISVDEFLLQLRAMIEEYRNRQYGRTHIEDSEEYQALLCKVLGHNIVPDYFEREEYRHCCGCMRLAKELLEERRGLESFGVTFTPNAEQKVYDDQPRK